MNAISVDVEISDKLKGAKLENGFYPESETVKHLQR